MPGLSFLFKKGFHPARLDNQKKLFMAEEEEKARKQREIESAKEVMKERELSSYESQGSIDPRYSSLKFMYAAPRMDDAKKEKGGKYIEPKIDNNGDDDMVRQFKLKYMNKQPAEILNQDAIVEKKQEEEEERIHPSLKNAPREGPDKSMPMHFKPFNEVIRNVQCLRCGQWGHRSVDKECPLKNKSLDVERQQREDPLYNANYQPTVRSTFFDENGDSDPEAEFLASLTRREKKLLLRKLEEIETGKKHPRNDDSDSDGDNSSSDDSSDGDSSDKNNKHISKKRKHRDHKDKKKHKHKKSSNKEHKKKSHKKERR